MYQLKNVSMETCKNFEISFLCGEERWNLLGV